MRQRIIIFVSLFFVLLLLLWRISPYIVCPTLTRTVIKSVVEETTYRRYQLYKIEHSPVQLKGNNLPTFNGTVKEILVELSHALVISGVKLIITQTSDLADESDFVQNVFLNTDEPVTRVGVFGEMVDLLKLTITKFQITCPQLRSRIILSDDPRPPGGKITTHIFLIIPLEDSSKVESNTLLYNSNEFFNWKRIHIQVFHRRGVSSEDQLQGYRWVGEEPDDSLQYKRTAESYEAFTTRPIKDLEHRQLFHVPSNKRFFMWQKESAEFKECPQHDEREQRTFADQPKGKKVTDLERIRKYMHSVMAVTRLLQRHRIHAWLSCGTLLGWYRQCSLIPKDGDVDVNHFSDPDAYPSLHVDVVNQRRIFRIRKKVIRLGPDPENRRGPGLSYDFKIRNGTNVDVWRVFRHKRYKIRNGRNPFLFHDKICSTDLHGYRVYVLCLKSRDSLTHDFGDDIMTPKEM